MSWGGPHRRYSASGGPSAVPAAPPPALASLAHPSPLASPPASLTAASPVSASPWGQGSAASSHAGSPATASTAAADDEQLQSLVSALRVALGKKEAALVSVAGQLGEAQGQLAACHTARRQLEAQVGQLQLSAPDRLSAAASVTPEGRLLAQARQEVGQAAARLVEVEGERDALLRDVAMLQQQLTAAAQVEALERERLCNEASQSRLLARARARQVEQLQAELRQAAGARSAASTAAAQEAQQAAAELAQAKFAAEQAQARAAAAEALAAQLQQKLEASQAAHAEADARTAKAEAGLAESQQQLQWQALRVAELEQTSSVGQLMRRYEGELQRLREQHDAERRHLHEQLAQAAQQQQPCGQQHAAVASMDPQEQAGAASGLDSAAWAALFEEPSASQQAESAREVQDAGAQTDGQPEDGAVPALAQAARVEIERLQQVNAGLLDAHSQAQHALQTALEQQRQAEHAKGRQEAARQGEATAQRLALEAAQRAEASLRQQLALTEQQLAHQNGELQALREANEKLELAATALKEELEAAGDMVPAQELCHLQAELQSAMAQTASLEGQVAQLKQQAAAASQQHGAALQQEQQRGSDSAAAQVAAAVQAAAAQHEQAAAALRAQLAEARQQLQAARSSLAELVQEQLLRREGMQDAAVQAEASQLAGSAAQTDGGWEVARQPPASVAVEAAPAASQLLFHERPHLAVGRSCSALESPPVHGSGAGGQAHLPPVAQTAKQLQLELARVRIGLPLRPLPGSGKPRAATRQLGQGQPPSRLASALGEHSLQGGQSFSYGGELPLLGGMEGGGGSFAGSANRLAEEDEDEGFFSTPLAQTPTAQAAEGQQASPFCSCPSPGSSAAAGLGGSGQLQSAEDSPLWQQHAVQQQQRDRRPASVAGQDVQQGQGRPYSSLSSASSPGRLGLPAEMCSPRSSPLVPAAEASASLSSLSSLGPSASQLGGWPHWGTSPAATTATIGSRHGCLGNFAPDAPLGLAAGSEGQHAGDNWHAARLDASLSRLAALTAGLLSGGAQR